MPPLPTITLTVLAAALLLSCSSPRGGSDGASNTAALNITPSTGVIDAINQYRTSRGKSPLSPHPGLTSLALTHSQSMASRGKMDHKRFLTRSSIARANYQLGPCAENVAKIPLSTPKATIVSLWIDSAPHRKNMLGDYDYVGFATAQAGSFSYATAIFGDPMEVRKAPVGGPREQIFPFEVPFF
ncbi:MAG: CAP domain-containing protein [Verrucomicrobiota bacterium JB023]|nr:CAP domain-containing protein [Verrucomicrobiota bacterium JB023]